MPILSRTRIVFIGVFAIIGLSPSLVAAADGKIAGGQSAAPASNAAPAKPHAIRFQCDKKPWREVLIWFAKEADLSLVMTGAPPGTFSYSRDREYTTGEAIDLLNKVLALNGFSLVRYEHMLILLNMEDPVPGSPMKEIRPEELDNLGEFEMVRVVFSLDKLSADDAAAEVKKIVGPLGKVVALPITRQLSVTDMVGRLRTIRTMINRIEKQGGAELSNRRVYELKYARTEDVLAILRQLLDIPEGELAASDGSFRIAVDPRNGRLLLITGQPEKFDRVIDVIQVLDVPPTSAKSAQEAIEPTKVIESPTPASDCTCSPAACRPGVKTLRFDRPRCRPSLWRRLFARCNRCS